MTMLWMALFAPVLFLVIFNPYTVYGKPGVAVGVAFFLVSFIIGTYKVALNNFIIPLSLMLLISLWGVAVSHLNDIGQFDFFYSALSFGIFIFTACGIAGFLNYKKIDFNGFALLLLCALIFNSIYILLEVAIPSLRDATESLLAPAGNIDWTQGVRYRGLAASGGSGLSICCTLGVIIGLDLYRSRKIGLVFFLLSSFIFLISVLFIGRTGLVFFPLAIIFYFGCLGLAGQIKATGFLLSLVVILICVVIFWLFYEVFYNYLYSSFGQRFIDYSFGFLLQGQKGLREEGTASVIFEFMTVLPLGFPEAFIGVGFYGGSNFAPWTDSGYARVMLSVGFVLGVVYYLCVFRIYLKSLHERRALIFSILFVLMLAEIKGSFLFSAYGARALILLVVYLQISIYYQRRLAAA
ncbi:hypothetical protein [Pseudomonas urmiensis]|uniref:hypothetical protein n=1 Tax=Pseudomonas urmiensis TaxID=2745493 RepID=UPI003CAD9D31